MVSESEVRHVVVGVLCQAKKLLQSKPIEILSEAGAKFFVDDVGENVRMNAYRLRERIEGHLGVGILPPFDAGIETSERLFHKSGREV